MKKLVFIICLFLCCSLSSLAQKSKVIAVFQLIETSKFKDAKEAVEELITEKKTKNWHRTWHARGLLCQSAYQEGKAKNKKENYELYPDQLFVALDSYVKARSLDKRGRLDDRLAPLYVLLANDFKELGEEHHNNRKYKQSLRAFESALQITKSPILEVRIDTHLIYNTALAAYEIEEWRKAIDYLNRLNEWNYSPNVSHLLYTIYLEKADTISAEKILIEGIDRYVENEDLVLLLTDILFHSGNTEKAIEILDSASLRDPLKYIFPFSKGLVYQKTDDYKKAIDAYKESLILNPDEIRIYSNIGTCYYNMGVEITKFARTITNNSAFLEEKERSSEAFESAVTWFEKAFDTEPDNQYIVTKLYELYKNLGYMNRISSLEGEID